ncbi:MAG: putative pyruvate formate lyase activating enzyme [Myxococcota bacterium]|jgi:putative pyruvate formate lyase activating enzyme
MPQPLSRPDLPSILTSPPPIDPDRLARAIAWADARYHACDVCAANCGVDRHAGPAGVCGLGAGARVYKEYVHFGEEACLIPSHTVFMSGCNFRCVFCSDDDQVRKPLAHGVEVPPKALAKRIAQRRAEGATNVNFVGGVPDVNMLFILRTLAHCPPDTHVVWNTNLWTTPTAIEHLDGVVGTWLADLKFGNDRCGRKLAQVEGYWDRLTALMTLLPPGRLLIRHLLMPGHLDCCTAPVLEWLERTLPETPINLMTGYHPYRLAGSRGPMGQPLPPSELKRALDLFDRRSLKTKLLDGREYPPQRSP